MVERLDRAAGWSRGRLSRLAVDRLYGRKVSMSASRMDKYKSCHFSYFMRYGLQAEPRKPAGFTAPEYGTFVHYVLEHVLRDEMFRQTVLPGFADPVAGAEGRRRLRELTRAAVDRYVEEELGGLEHQTERFRYLFRRLLRSVQAVVDNVAEELAASQFRPISFELGFGSGQDLPPVELTVDGVTISVTGFVDRVDGWVHDGRLYLRVVDYKTGKKSLRPDGGVERAGPSDAALPVRPGGPGAGLLRTAGGWGRGALSPRPGRGGQGEPRHDRRGVAGSSWTGSSPAAAWCWTIQRCCPPWRSRGKRATASCP